MTQKQAKRIWNEYNRLGEIVIANRAKMAKASREEKRRLILENHELICKMDRLTR